jgi:hypothetical protein
MSTLESDQSICGWALTLVWEACTLLDAEDGMILQIILTKAFSDFDDGQIVSSLRSFYRVSSERGATQLSLLMALSSIHNSFRAAIVKQWDAMWVTPMKVFPAGEPQLIRTYRVQVLSRYLSQPGYVLCNMILQEDISKKPRR